ncbi:hypothetical protein CMI47_11165 [Candidatus Pacearchaeota archaeon]|nr:hypothetical protein [Candidatus Pacearchaeota archaeon]|tara:strand:- start:9542 stop:10027 length:486 start_codon:yes stop_codon:yes gene_type:complete
MTQSAADRAAAAKPKRAPAKKKPWAETLKLSGIMVYGDYTELEEAFQSAVFGMGFTWESGSTKVATLTDTQKLLVDVLGKKLRVVAVSTSNRDQRFNNFRDYDLGSQWTKVMDLVENPRFTLGDQNAKFDDKGGLQVGCVHVDAKMIKLIAQISAGEDVKK